MKKKLIVFIAIFAFLASLFVPVAEGYAHTHTFVLYERHLEDTRTRQCRESNICTVTEYYYSNRYKCNSCDYNYIVNTVDVYHSYNH